MPTVEPSLAVVCALSQGSNQGDSSLVYCLPLESVGSDGSDVRVAAGEPFRLHNRSGRYIWGNEQLRNEGINTRGAVIYQCSTFYRGNTERKMDMDTVLSQLTFVDQGGVVHRGVKDAFSNAEIRRKGIYVNQDVSIMLALVSIRAARILDGRVFIQTLQEAEKESNLKHNCRSTKQSTIEEVLLPVGVPQSDESVGSVALLKVGEANQAVCEGLMLSPANPEETLTSVHFTSYCSSCKPKHTGPAHVISIDLAEALLLSKDDI